MKNFHLPLPEQTLAHEAVDWWLRQQFRKARQDAIAAYAAEMAETHLDLDSDLESAAVDHLVKADRRRALPCVIR